MSVLLELSAVSTAAEDARESPSQSDPLDVPPQPLEEPGQPNATNEEEIEAVDSSEKQKLDRTPGKSLLPFARVQKILKADEDLPPVSKEVTHMISVACEEFLRLISKAAHELTVEDERTTLLHRDLASIVRREDKFLFLKEIIPWESKRPPPKKGDSKKDDSKKAESRNPKKPEDPKMRTLESFVGEPRNAGDTAGIPAAEDPSIAGPFHALPGEADSDLDDEDLRQETHDE
ncbi:hypothetical protein HGRIS_005840 [Hohenbuehelia grisea]|uniref:Transcription factor CBF/NF-Y/archaeal histone domain-containing protein n=1 Tax=Hohenbuehelia grisea TaxID=104357 RepID=A0ABR3K0F0_9AGAR